MKRWIKPVGLALALAFLALTFVNASCLADEPPGAPRLIAHRGIAQHFDRTGIERDTCTASRIETPSHAYLENTVRGAVPADALGAAMIEVDVVPTRDGQIALFHDWTLDCRTDGSGETRNATLGELKALDAGYGYTADGGASYPLRGTGVGAIPTLEEMHTALPRTAKLMFDFKSDDPAEADLLARTLAEAGRDPEARRDAFTGPPAPVARIRELFPQSWAWSPAEAKQCSRDYVMWGWSGILPASCRGRTMVIPLNRQWVFWGFPTG